MKQLVRKSLRFDIEFLAMKALLPHERLWFIIQKYKAFLGLLMRQKGHIRFKNISIQCPDISSLGTLQSSIVDFYHDIVAAHVITKSAPLIIDVGANIGQFCAAAKLFYPKATVYSFEPDPEVFQLLRANTEHLPDVQLINNGLGDKEQTQPFYVSDESVKSSFKPQEDHDYRKSQVRQLRLKPFDNAFKQKQPIDLMKIDVEGFEMNVLRGAAKNLPHVDYLLLELSLERDAAEANNLSLLSLVHRLVPKAKIIKFGRPLGNINRPVCQDVLIAIGRKV